MKTLNELQSEIRQEAEENVTEKIYGKRALIIFIVLSLFIIVAFEISSNANQPGHKASLLLFYGAIFVIIATINIPHRLAELIHLKPSKRTGILIENEFKRIVRERTRTYPEDIEDLKKSIAETAYRLQDFEKECEEDIQSDETEIESMQNELELLTKIA